MDITTLLGLVIGIAVVVLAAMTGSDLWIFINLPGLLIVLGGTFAATLIKFPLRTVFVAFRVGLRAAFGNESSDPRLVIEDALELTRVVRREGWLSAEKVEVRNSFFRKAVQLCIDGFDIEVVRDTLEHDRNLTAHRQEAGEKIFRAIGDSAPAFGMVGTLVGLVQMLSAMDDPKSIGPAMAVALLTTLYGALIANLVAIPVADKLVEKREDDHIVKALVIEAVTGISEGRSPDVLSEMVQVYLPEKQRRFDTPEAAEAPARKPA